MAEHDQRFDSHAQWVNMASRWLTRHPDYHEQFYRAICFDNIGRICRSGREFRIADEEGTFPIHWVWPDQNLFEAIDNIRKENGDE